MRFSPPDIPLDGGSPPPAVPSSIYDDRTSHGYSDRYDPWAAVCAASYLLVNIAYSLRLKHMAFVDVSLIAAGFVLRVLAGAFAIAVPASLAANGMPTSVQLVGPPFSEALLLRVAAAHEAAHAEP